MARRVIAASAVALGMAGAMAGCGSAESASSNPTGMIETAYVSTVNAKTAHFHVTETLRLPSTTGGSHTVTISGSGDLSFASKAAAVTISVPGVGDFHVVLTAPDMYLQVPAADRNLVPGGKPWMEINLDQLAQAKLGASLSQLTSEGSTNPADQLAELQAVSGQVTTLGRATVAGVATTEYQADVQLSKLEALVRARSGAQAAQVLVKESQELHISTLPIKVWLDGHHRVRQYQGSVSLPASATAGSTGGSATMTMTMTVTLDSLGGAADVTPPPPSQVANITSRLIGGGATSA